MPLLQPALLLTALLATALVNPYGIGLPCEWLQTIAMPLPSLIEEHGPILWNEPVAWATAVLGAVYAAVLLSTLPGRPRVVWLLPLVWLVLAVARVRMAPLFAVTAVVAIGDMLPQSPFGRWLQRRQMLVAQASPPAGSAVVQASPPAKSSVEQASLPATWVLLPLAVVGAALAIQAAGLEVPVVGRGWAQFDQARWPIAMLPDLQDVADRSDPRADVPIFNDLLFGGFLIYYEPRSRVFIDDRCPLYGTEFLLAYDRARREDPAQIDWWQQQYGFGHALVEPGCPFDRYLSTAAGWSIVRRSRAAALYRHR